MGISYSAGVYSGPLTAASRQQVYIAPSGVQKERIQPRDIFVLTLSSRSFLRWPTHKPLKQSACTPLFYNAYELRDAGACIHTHSQHAVMATLLWKGNEFRISHQEMIKGMRIAGTGTALSYLDTLVIPIIENTPDEEDLREGMEEVRLFFTVTVLKLTLVIVKAMRKYPDAVRDAPTRWVGPRSLSLQPAVLVRRHGTYSWGAGELHSFWSPLRSKVLKHSSSDWEKAKAQAECLDYLLEVAVKMRLAGLETVGLS